MTEKNELDHAKKRVAQLEDERDELLAALEKVIDVLDGYIDIEDGSDGPRANGPMRAVDIADRAIAKAKGA